MLRYYHRLGVSRQEMLCIIHLASYHYNSPAGESRPAAEGLPCAQETALCRSAFGVPDGAQDYYGDHTVTIRWPSLQWGVEV